jgi:hypothetical protein
MSDIRFGSAAALFGYMEEGNRISLIEAMLIFGVQSPNREFTNIKKRGYIIKKERVPMAKVLRRINQFIRCEAPKELPVSEIFLTEYWIQK